MKLAEALAIRKDTQKRIEQLKSYCCPVNLFHI